MRRVGPRSIGRRQRSRPGFVSEGRRESPIDWVGVELRATVGVARTAGGWDSRSCVSAGQTSAARGRGEAGRSIVQGRCCLWSTGLIFAELCGTAAMSRPRRKRGHATIEERRKEPVVRAGRRARRSACQEWRIAGGARAQGFARSADASTGFRMTTHDPTVPSTAPTSCRRPRHWRSSTGPSRTAGSRRSTQTETSRCGWVPPASSRQLISDRPVENGPDFLLALGQCLTAVAPAGPASDVVG